jgi:RimJ/RimL family protein N-acetyltransferase
VGPNPSLEPTRYAAARGSSQTLARMKTITTPSFVLEPQVAAHASEMFSVLSDVAIYEFENEPPISEEWLRTRYERLESRGPDDQSEVWLNWVIRLQDGNLVGYVQATVFQDQSAYVAYELNSHYWRRGIGSQAVQAVLEELRHRYVVSTCFAVLKDGNYRSSGLLRKLGFVLANEELTARHRDEIDEIVMVKPLVATHAA